MEQEIRRLINAFEEGGLSAEATAEKLSSVANRPVDADELRNYWRSQSLDDLVRRLCLAPVEDWRSITDGTASALLQELLDNVADDALVERNSTALERRYGKPEGTVIDLVFEQDVDDVPTLLAKLKADHTIRL